MWSLPEGMSLPAIDLPPLPEKQLIISTAMSAAASALILHSILRDLVPAPVTGYLYTRLRRLTTGISPTLTVVIEESNGLVANQMYEAASLYLAASLSQSTSRIKVRKPEKEKEVDVAIDRDQEVVDYFEGVKMKWYLSSSSTFSQTAIGVQSWELRFFELTFKKKHRAMVLSSYLPHILAQAKSIKEAKKTVKLYTIDYNGRDYWGAVNFNHPATFDTVAMDPELKKALVADLDAFVGRKEFYKKVGKAWKRGYLLYGPPGTGKSSLVAAMANYLKFDVYDLDLKGVQCNSDLRRLLISTGNRSILVMEDFDRTFASVEEEGKITMAGMLNFVDGLWSTCGEEKLLVFTTNHKEELDPALLRPGRVDLQVNMSYCTFTAFKTLAYNYLGETDHELFGEIEKLLAQVEATPAEVAGEMLMSKNADLALRRLVKLLRSRKQEAAGSLTAVRAEEENGLLVPEERARVRKNTL